MVKVMAHVYFLFPRIHGNQPFVSGQLDGFFGLDVDNIGPDVTPVGAPLDKDLVGIPWNEVGCASVTGSNLVNRDLDAVAVLHLFPTWFGGILGGKEVGYEARFLVTHPHRPLAVL